MTRIIYKKEGNNLVNKHPMLLGSEAIKVVVDPQQLVTVVYDQNNQPLNHFTSKSLLALKIRTKRELKQMGVQFFDEIRTKRT